MMRTPCTIALLALAGGTMAATVTFDWSIDWVEAAPDGYARPVIGINGHWPCPVVEANVGDTVVVNLQNNLGNETTGLHFHGIRQYGSPEMDGPVAATQCSVPPGSSFTYSFVVCDFILHGTPCGQLRFGSPRLILPSYQADMAGTYWYHSHEMGQYPDGLRGPLIVHDPDDPYCNQVDEEVIMTVSDW